MFYLAVIYVMPFEVMFFVLMPEVGHAMSVSLAYAQCSSGLDCESRSVGKAMNPSESWVET